MIVCMSDMKYIKQSHHKGLLRVHRLRQVRPGRNNTGQVVELNPRGTFQISQSVKNSLPQVIDIIVRVLVLHDLYGEMDLLVVAIPRNEGIVFGNIIVDFDAQGHSRLVCPTSRHVLDSITSTPHHQRRHAEAQHEIQTSRMPLYTQVELAQFVVAERIGPQLHEQGMGPELAHHSRHHVLKQLVESIIRNTRFERDIQREFLSISLPLLEQPTSPREEVVSILMKRHSHAAIGQVKRLLHPISVMDINVQVKNPRVDIKQFDNCQHYVVHVAEPTGLRFLGMMQPPSPVDSDVRLTVEQQTSRINRCPRRDLAEVVQSIESGTVSRLAHLKPLPLLKMLKPARVGSGVSEPIDAHAGQLASDVLADELLQVIEVVLGVEAPHFIAASLPRVVDVEVSVETSVDHQGVSHGNALGLHWVLLRVDELPKSLVVEVGDLPLAFSIHCIYCRPFNCPYSPQSAIKSREIPLEPRDTSVFHQVLHLLADLPLVRKVDALQDESKGVSQPVTRATGAQSTILASMIRFRLPCRILQEPHGLICTCPSSLLT